MNSKIKFVMMSGVALTVWGGSALAADIAPPASDWTGVYVGIGGGGAFNFSNTDAGGYSYFGLLGDDLDEKVKVDGKDVSIPTEYDVDFPFGSGGMDCTASGGGGYCDLETFSAAAIGDGAELSGMMSDVMNGFLSDLVSGGGDGDSDTGAASAFGTAELGFDYQIGSNFVIGVNGAFNLGSTDIQNSAASIGAGSMESWKEEKSKDDSLVLGGGGGALGALETDLELGNSWSLGARAGYLASDNILLFVSGGYVSTKAELSASYSSDVGAGAGGKDGKGDIDGGAEHYVSSSNDEWLNGYYIGGGVEALMTENVSFKLEYRYADLGSIDTSSNLEAELGGGPNDTYIGYAAAGVSAEADPVEHSVRATINWRF